MWKLCGVDVCRTAWVNIIGMTERSMVRMCRGLSGHVARMPLHRECRQLHQVNQFFLELYMSAAEPMPHEDYVVGTGVDDDIACDDDPWAPAAADVGDEPPNAEWDPDRSVPSVVQAFLGQDVGLRRRFLQNSCLSHLYWLFLAGFERPGVQTSLSDDSGSDDDGTVQVEHGRPALPSFSTFKRAWHQSWSQLLVFRSTSQHAECKTCFEARERIHAPGTSMADRLVLARQWKEHLRLQYHDRAIYWYCRYASRQKLNVLTIIIDSMDKAKFAWPMYPWHKVSKELDIRRPRLVLTAALAHGYGTFLFIADECLPHGASAFNDVLARVLEKVADMSRRSGVRMPMHLVVQSDNTTAQAKNHEANCFLAYLVAKYKFQTCSLFFLVVGHTHEDVDQFFGMVKQHVLRRVKVQTKEELVQCLKRIMGGILENKSEPLFVDTLEHIRDFLSWTDTLKIELYNAFGTRQGIEAPHSFVYKMRRDLLAGERDMIPQRARGYTGEDCDVFCCVKTYMHSSCLQQPPLMVLPASRTRAANITAAAPEATLARATFSAERCNELRGLAALLRGPQFNLHRGAAALEKLANGPPPVEHPPSPWLASGDADYYMPLVPSGNELYPHLPESSWHLLVRFKR